MEEEGQFLDTVTCIIYYEHLIYYDHIINYEHKTRS